MSMNDMPTSTRGLGRSAIRGASVTLVGQGARVLVLLASTVVLSRLLAPRDFGLIAIVTSVVALGELVRDFGLSTAAARATVISRGQKSNLFWINAGVGSVLTIIACLTAPAIASAFRQPSLSGILLAISPVFFCSGLATQFRAELNRQLRFTALTICDTAPIALGLAGALVYAAIDRSYWVLVAQQLIVAVSGLVLVVALTGWWPGLPDRRASVKTFLSFGAGLFGTQAVAYVTKNIDNIILGLFWGPSVLGLYTRAYQLLMLPINQIAAPLTRVAVPILSRVAADGQRFNRYVNSGQLIGGVIVGLLYGISFGLAGPLVQIIFGSQWTSMTAIFQALAVGGVFRALNQITFWVFLAKDASVAQFRFYLVSQPLIIAAILCGLPWGGFGVAVGHSIGYGLNWVLSVWWCGRVTKTPVRTLFVAGTKSLLVFVLPSAVIGTVAVALVSNVWLEVAVGLMGIFAYLCLAYLISRYVRTVASVLWAGAQHLRRSDRQTRDVRVSTIVDRPSRQLASESRPSDSILIIVPWLEGGGAQGALESVMKRLADSRIVVAVLFNGSSNHGPILSRADEVIELDRPRTPLGAIGAAVRLRKLIRSYDTVYSLMRGSHVVLGLVSPRLLARTRFAATFHQLPSSDSVGARGRLEDLLVRRAVRRATLVTTPSARAAREIVDAGFAESHAVVVEANLLESAPVSVCEPRRGELPDVRLLFAGRLTHQKGLDRIAELLNGVDRPVHLQIAGGGEDRQTIETAAEHVDRRHRVEFVGRVDDIWPYLADADAVFMPSRSELNPLFIWEAWAYGRGAFTTDLEVFADLATQGPVWTFANASDFASQLDRFAEDEAVRQSAFVAGQRSYNSRQMGSSLVEFLRGAATRARRS